MNFFAKKGSKIMDFSNKDPGVIEVMDKQPTVAIYCHGIPAIFFFVKYDLILLLRQIIHQNDGISKRN